VNLSLYIKYFIFKLLYIMLVCKGVVKGELWSNMALKGKVFGVKIGWHWGGGGLLSGVNEL
jgi:hypothetical protein